MWRRISHRRMSKSMVINLGQVRSVEVRGQGQRQSEVLFGIYRFCWLRKDWKQELRWVSFELAKHKRTCLSPSLEFPPVLDSSWGSGMSRSSKPPSDELASASTDDGPSKVSSSPKIRNINFLSRRFGFRLEPSWMQGPVLYNVTHR